MASGMRFSFVQKKIIDLPIADTYISFPLSEFVCIRIIFGRFLVMNFQPKIIEKNAQKLVHENWMEAIQKPERNFNLLPRD